MDFRRLTQKQLGSAFGVTDRAVRKWDGCPRNKDNTYCLPDVIEWRIENEKNKMVDLDMDTPATTEALEEYRRVRVEISRRELDQLDKKLGPVDLWGAALTDRAFELTRRLLLFSRRVAHRVAATSKKTQKEVVAIIDDEIRQVMNDYARPIDLEYETLKK